MIHGGPEPAAAKAPAFESIFTRGSLIILLALLLGETTINFIDRQVLSVLAPTLRAEFHLNNSQYALIVNAFLATYAVAYAFAGWVLDRLGVGRGLTLAVIWWSAAGMLTSIARGPFSLGFLPRPAGDRGSRRVAIVCQSSRDMGPARSPYAGHRRVQQRIEPRRHDRAAAGRLDHLAVGWRAAFIVDRRHRLPLGRGVPALPLAAIHEMAAAPSTPSAARDRRRAGARCIRYRQTWAVFFCRFLADPLWYFYVFWIPEFLTRERGLNLAGIGRVAWIPFLVADIANFAGGYLTLRLQRAGWSVNRTRKTLMVLATVLSPVGIFAVFQQSLFWTIALISIAVFFWMFWSVSVHSLSGDYFPPRAVGSVYGIAGTGSTVGSVISTWAVGKTLDVTHSYTPVFIGIGVLMPVALLVGFLLMRKVEPVEGFDA